MRGIQFIGSALKNISRNTVEDTVLGLPLGLTSKIGALGGVAKNPLKTIRQEAGMDISGINFNSQRHLRIAGRRADSFATDLKNAQPPITLNGSLNDGDLALPDGRTLRVQSGPTDNTYRLSLSNGKPEANWKIPSTQYDIKLDPKTGEYKTQQLSFPRAFLGNKPRQQVAYTGIADKPVNEIMQYITPNV